MLRLRGREAPVELDFRTWAAEHTDERTAAMLSAAAGVYTFYHDPGELSAAFVWTRTVRTLLSATARGALPARWLERGRELAGDPRPRAGRGDRDWLLASASCPSHR